MLRNQLANHFKMAELLNGDVLQHVANGRVFDVKGLHPILERSSQFSCCATELFEQELTKRSIRFSNVHRLDEVQQANAIVAAMREVELLIIADHLEAGMQLAVESKNTEAAVKDMMAVLRPAIRK